MTAVEALTAAAVALRAGAPLAPTRADELAMHLQALTVEIKARATAEPGRPRPARLVAVWTREEGRR